MSRSAAIPNMTYAEYLAAEATSIIKHEWLRGEVFAMAGGTAEHARLAVSVAAELRAALRGRPCAVFSSDLRVWELHEALAGDRITLTSIGCELEVDEVYRNPLTA